MNEVRFSAKRERPGKKFEAAERDAPVERAARRAALVGIVAKRTGAARAACALARPVPARLTATPPSLGGPDRARPEPEDTHLRGTVVPWRARRYDFPPGQEKKSMVALDPGRPPRAQLCS